MPIAAHTGDTLIITLVLAGIGVAAFRATRGRKGAGTAEYFFASKTVEWPALAISLAVTTVWGIWAMFAAMPVSLGLPGWIIPGAVAVLGLLLLGVVFSPLYRMSHATTLPAFLGERYGRGVGLVTAGVSVAVTLLVLIPFTILIGSRLLNALLEWELMSSALLMIAVPGLIVIAGGYHAVIATHSASGIAAGIGALFLAVNGFFPGETIMHRVVPDGDTSLTQLLAGLTIVGLWFACIDQYAVQRTVAARSSLAMRRGTAGAAFLVVLGVCALATGFGSSPGTIGMAGNSVAEGFVGAAIISLVIATLAGLFMSAATVFALDVFPAGRTTTDEAALVLVGRLANTVVVILAIMAASSITMTGAGSVFWMARALIIALPPVVAILILGLTWARMHGRGALWALILGWATGVGYTVVSVGGVGAEMYGVLLTFVVSTIVCVVVSLIAAPPRSLEQEGEAILTPGLQVRKP
jgi:SSS family solute:Na+ symporter